MQLEVNCKRNPEHWRGGSLLTHPHKLRIFPYPAEMWIDFIAGSRVIEFITAYRSYARKKVAFVILFQINALNDCSWGYKKYAI